MAALTPVEVERCVDELYVMGKVRSRTKVLYPTTLARIVWGPDSIVLVPGMEAAGKLTRYGGKWFAQVRASLSSERIEDAVGHEMLHWFFFLHGYEGEESACDAGSAAIRMRREVFLPRVERSTSHSLKRLAHDFGVTETSAAMRIGETTDRPIAVVTPERVHVRGARWPWGSRQNLQKHEKRTGPGITKVRLTDEPGRTALMVGT